MIDWERTELRPYGKQNFTHVWVVCHDCEKGRWVIASEARKLKLPGHLCRPCALRAIGRNKRYLDPDALGKICPRCKEYKLRSEYGLSKRKSDGLQSVCRACQCRMTRRYRQRHPEKSRSSRRIAQAKRRAAKKNSWGNFDDDDWKFVLGKYGYECLACGETAGLQPDHVIPLSKGGIHHKSNIQPLCGKCNRKKQAQIVDYRPDAYWADWT